MWGEIRRIAVRAGDAGEAIDAVYAELFVGAALMALFTGFALAAELSVTTVAVVAVPIVARGLVLGAASVRERS